MRNFTTILQAVENALRVPLTPAPCRTAGECAVYRLIPGKSDGALERAYLHIRVFCHTAADAAAQQARLRAALIADGDSGVLGTGVGALIVCATDRGGEVGVAKSGMYYCQSGFEICGRA